VSINGCFIKPVSHISAAKSHRDGVLAALFASPNLNKILALTNVNDEVYDNYFGLQM
jgi:hypothetical protein